MTTSSDIGRKDYSLDNFVAIRLIAAILVVFGHSFPLTGTEGPAYLGNPISTIAVKVFFVISGYLISESWLRDPHLGRYLQRRALRIFPALIVMCLLTILFIGPVVTRLGPSEYFANSSTWRYLQNVFLYPNYGLPGVFEQNTYPNAVNGSLWTLPIEFSMYLLTPLILLLPGARFWVWIVAIALSMASVWLSRINIPVAPVVFYGTNVINGLEMSAYFVWGMVYRFWLRDGWLDLQKALFLTILLPLLVVDWASAEIVSLVLIPYVTLALGNAPLPKFAWVERYGDFSYGAYLYGFLVQQILASFITTPNQHWLNFILAAPIALLLGMLSWRLVEKPAMRLKPRRK